MQGLIEALCSNNTPRHNHENCRTLIEKESNIFRLEIVFTKKLKVLTTNIFLDALASLKTMFKIQ